MVSYLESREVVRVGFPSLQLLASRLPLGAICRSRGGLQSPPKVEQAQRHCFAGHFDREAHGDLWRTAQRFTSRGNVGGGAKQQNKKWLGIQVLGVGAVDSAYLSALWVWVVEMVGGWRGSAGRTARATALRLSYRKSDDVSSFRRVRHENEHGTLNSANLRFPLNKIMGMTPRSQVTTWVARHTWHFLTRCYSFPVYVYSSRLICSRVC